MADLNPVRNAKKIARDSKLFQGVKSAQQAWQDLVNEAKGNISELSRYPQYLTGSRAYVIVSGKPLALAMNVSWTIVNSAEEIRTVDTAFPWDISVGQTTVRASLRELIDPDLAAETEGIWTTMASTIHQPLVELEVFDKLGARQFMARGMFVSLTNQVALGNMAERGVEFIGVLYAGNVSQSFKPYSQENSVAKFFKEGAKTIARLTGGIL